MVNILSKNNILSENEKKILFILYKKRSETWTNNKISTETGINKGTISSNLKRMLKKGMVIKRDHRENDIHW